jgi:hypothetical protein
MLLNTRLEDYNLTEALNTSGEDILEEEFEEFSSQPLESLQKENDTSTNATKPKSLLSKGLSFLNKFVTTYVKFETSNIKVTLPKQAMAEGGFSSVYIATNSKNAEIKYALKKIPIFTEEIETDVKLEIEYLTKFQHEHIVKLLDFKYYFDGRTKYAYILFPLLSETLRQRISRIEGQRTGTLENHINSSNLLIQCVLPL